MIKKRGVALAAAGLVASAAVNAQDFGELSYDYAELNYVDTELDAGPFNPDGDGLEIAGSVALTDTVHVFASYDDLDFGRGIDRSTLRVGGGYHWELTSNVDVVAELAIASTDIDGPGRAGFDADGFIVGAALRGWMRPDVELTGGVSLDDSDDSDTDIVVEFGGQYYLNEQFSVGGQITIDEDVTSLFLGGRYYFRRNTSGVVQ